MTPNESPELGLALDEEDESAQIRRKLLWRMGAAGLMIVALLGGLALFDHLATGPREPEYVPPRFTEPVPVPPPKPVTETLGPVVPMPEEGETEKQAAGETPDTSVPEATAVPAAPADAPPADVAPAAPPAGAAARPAPGHAAARPSSRTAAPSIVPPSAPPAARSEQKGSQEPALPSPPPRADAPRPEVSRPDATRVLPSRQSTVLPRPLPGYTLQAGVFTDPRRAEDVQARLAQEGIPATLETRVLVGPFKNQKEADAARAKMRAMGIEALLVPRAGKK